MSNRAYDPQHIQPHDLNISPLGARRMAAAAASTGQEARRARANLTALQAVTELLAVRERELLTLKGPCSNKACRLHYKHEGVCAPAVERG